MSSEDKKNTSENTEPKNDSELSLDELSDMSGGDLGNAHISKPKDIDSSNV